MEFDNKDQLSGADTRKLLAKRVVRVRGKFVEITGMSGIVWVYFKVMCACPEQGFWKQAMNLFQHVLSFIEHHNAILIFHILLTVD